MYRLVSPVGAAWRRHYLTAPRWCCCSWVDSNGMLHEAATSEPAAARDAQANGRYETYFCHRTRRLDCARKHSPAVGSRDGGRIDSRHRRAVDEWLRRVASRPQTPTMRALTNAHLRSSELACLLEAAVGAPPPRNRQTSVLAAVVAAATVRPLQLRV